MDLGKWVSAGLTWPLVRPVSKRLQVAAKPPGVVYRLTERHAKLLRLFDKADEVGKQHLEQAASFAAAQSIQVLVASAA